MIDDQPRRDSHVLGHTRVVGRVAVLVEPSNNVFIFQS